MTLTRGSWSLFPCPRCIVSADKLCDHTWVWPDRTDQDMKSVYVHALSQRTQKNREAALMEYGLRGIKVESSSALLLTDTNLATYLSV